MIRLAPQINRNRSTYVLVCRSEKNAVYAKTVQGIDTTYEVFKIKVRNASSVRGVPIPSCEIFPNDEAFGVWAWALWTLDKAMIRFRKLELEQG